MFSSIVLTCSSKEGLSKEETRNPESLRSFIIYPFLDKVNSVKIIKNPRSKWFQGWIGSLVPNFRNLVIEKTGAYSFKFNRKRNFTFNGFTNINKTCNNNIC